MRDQHPKLSLSSDFGSAAHWRRLVDYAAANGVERLVFWGDYAKSAFKPPYLYPDFPGLLPETERPMVEEIRERFRDAAQMCRDAGIAFWYAFQILELPADLTDARKAYPELFNAVGEVDAGSALVRRIIETQLRELVDLAPNLEGVEVWMMECATITLSNLRHQALPLETIYAGIIDALSGRCRGMKLRLALEIHSAGGNKDAMEAMTRQIRRHPEIIFSCDNVFADFHLMMPLNPYIRLAAAANPVQCGFDLYGEYWGRNLVPTSALTQYEEHLREVLALNPVYVNGRISTGHDLWSVHRNVLPSRRALFPELAGLAPGRPPRTFPEIAAFDTLGAFNVEFFLRFASDPQNVTAERVVREFLSREFGREAEPLTSVLLAIEPLNRKLFYADSNRYGFQSAFWKSDLVAYNQLPYHLTETPGTIFDPARSGFCRPSGRSVAGAEAMIAEKIVAVREAEDLLAEVREKTRVLDTASRAFLVGLFEDLRLFALAARWLLEAQAHFYLRQAGKKQGGLPDRNAFANALTEARAVADRWAVRYPSENFGDKRNHWNARYAPNNYGLPDGLKRHLDFLEQNWKESALL